MEPTATTSAPAPQAKPATSATPVSAIDMSFSGHDSTYAMLQVKEVATFKSQRDQKPAMSITGRVVSDEGDVLVDNTRFIAALNGGAAATVRSQLESNPEIPKGLPAPQLVEKMKSSMIRVRSTTALEIQESLNAGSRHPDRWTLCSAGIQHDPTVEF